MGGTSYSNEKRNRFCMCTHLNLISMLFFHTSVPSREHKPGSTKASGHRATVMRSRIDLHVHSPKFNLHTVLPHLRLDPESAQPESQRHQDTAWEALATVMKGGIDLHVHSPKFNIHATHPSRSRERKPGRKHKGIRASGYSNEKRNRYACALTSI